MKECPFCLMDVEDDEIKCSGCGYMFPVEEKNYNVVIESVGPNKIAVIKEIKEYFNCGLAEAKAKCENFIVERGLDKASAVALADKLCEVGAKAKVVNNEELHTIEEEIKLVKSNIARTPMKFNLMMCVIIGIALLVAIIAIIVTLK